MENIVNNPTSSDNNPSAGAGTPSEIDLIFGDVDSNEGIDGSASSGSDIASEASSSDAHDDLTGLNAEEIIKKLQSTKDKYRTQLDVASKKLEQLQPLESFLNQIYDDEEVRRAFIAELEPELIKPKDPYVALQEQLGKEFGESFTPDDDEAKRPFTESWRYYKRVDELLKSIEDRPQLPKALKEIRAERKRQKEIAAQSAAEERLKILSTMKWQDESYDHFAKWVASLSGTDLAKIYSFTLRKQGRAPQLATTVGGTSTTPNTIAAELNKFFG